MSCVKKYPRQLQGMPSKRWRYSGRWIGEDSIACCNSRSSTSNLWSLLIAFLQKNGKQIPSPFWAETELRQKQRSASMRDRRSQPFPNWACMRKIGNTGLFLSSSFSRSHKISSLPRILCPGGLTLSSPDSNMMSWKNWWALYLEYFPLEGWCHLSHKLTRLQSDVLAKLTTSACKIFKWPHFMPEEFRPFTSSSWSSI